MNNELQFEEVPLIDLDTPIRLSEEINVINVQLEEYFNKAITVQNMLKEITSFSTSTERLSEITKTLESYDILNITEDTPIKTLTDFTISYEGKTLDMILDAIDNLIKKIVEVLKNYIAVNRILANYLDKELKYGVFSNVRKVNITKYEFLVSPFYKKQELKEAMAVLSPIIYKDQIKDATSFEEALGDRIVKAAGSLGWVVKGGAVLKHNEKIIGSPVASLGWAIDDIPVVVRNTNLLLLNNIIEGRRAVKYFERLIRQTDVITTADSLRRRLMYIHKAVNMVQEIGVDIAWCLLHIGRKLK